MGEQTSSTPSVPNDNSGVVYNPVTFSSDKFRIAFEKNGVKAYAHINPADYHTNRYIELNNQMIYASSGATKDVLGTVLDQILERVNSDKPVSTFRTDIGVLCNSLKYRMKYPVDELASLRMGAVLCFLEGEDPNTCTSFWISNKMQLAKSDPDWYTFFLTLGVEQQRQFNPSLDISTSGDYFKNRQTNLESLSLLSK